MQKVAYQEVTGIIHCLSGLRVGGSDELLIGGTDLTCIKHPVTLKPYIPGSSIKGKMRSELEQKLGKFGGRESDEPCGFAAPTARCPGVRAAQASETLAGTDADRRPRRAVRRRRRDGTEVRERHQPQDRHGPAPTKGGAGHGRLEFSLRIGIQIWDLDKDVKYGDKTGADALVGFIKDGLRPPADRHRFRHQQRLRRDRVPRLKLNGQPFTL